MKMLLEECKKCPKHKYMQGTLVVCQRKEFTAMIITSHRKGSAKREVDCMDNKK